MLRDSPYTPLLPVTNQCSFNSASATTDVAKHILNFITTLFFLLLFTCTLFIVVEVCFIPRKPIFYLNSLSVANFTVSKTKLAGIWAADFTISNPNSAAEISFESIESTVLYKGNDALAITSSENFDVGFRGEKNVEMKFETSGYDGDQPIVEYPVLREIDEERKSTGTVRFGIRLSMWATYKTSYYWGTWRRRVLTHSSCLNLNVGVFAGNGSLIGDDKRYCHVGVMISER